MLLITLYVRARESKRPDAIIKDEKAVEMVNQIDRDFSQLRLQQHDEVAIIMRMRKFDDHVRDFLLQHPDAIAVHIGCRSDTRFERVANIQAGWFDLDIPNVIELRKKSSSRVSPATITPLLIRIFRSRSTSPMAYRERQ